MLALIIQLVAGAIGGLGTGTVLKEKSLGTAGNSIVGAVGGMIAGQLLAMTGAAPAATDAAATAATGGMGAAGIVTALAAGVVGGGVLTAIVGYGKAMMAK